MKLSGPHRDGLPGPAAAAAIAALFLAGSIIAPDVPIEEATARPPVIRSDVGASPGASRVRLLSPDRAATVGHLSPVVALAPAPFPLRLREPRLVVRIPVRATAYTSSVDETDSTPWIGACGRVGPGTVAVSSDLMRVAPCNASVRVLGRRYTVRDHMPGRGRVDVWHPSKAEARRFGVRRAVLEVE